MTTTLIASKSYLFSSLCQLCEFISHANRSGQLTAIGELWRSFSRDDCDSFFCLMRLLMPQLDTRRSTYGLKESKIAKYYIELLGIDERGVDAQRLLHWKNPSRSDVDTTAFSDAVYIVLMKRGFQESTDQSPSILDLNRSLDRLASAQPSERKDIYFQIVTRMSASEHRWLIRIIMKDMRMKMQHNAILGAFHPSAIELFNSCSDLENVCKVCLSPAVLSGSTTFGGSVSLMRPFKPMLASVIESEKLRTLFEQEKLIVEPKYDGERILVHMQMDSEGKENLRFWSRNGKDFTDLYAPKIGQHVLDSVRGRARNCILDGELMLFDSQRQRMMPFGYNRTFATGGDKIGPTTDTADHHACFFRFMVFDIPFLNGESLCTTSLERRKQLLTQVVVPSTFVHIVSHQPVRSVGEVLSKLEEAIGSQFEGVMIKVAHSHYVPGERKLKWMKVKPDHIVGMSDSLDLVVLGAYFGTKFGSRSLSHFLLGSPCDVGSETKYHTVCKVGTGYNSEELRALQGALEGRWTPAGASFPPWFDGWKAGAGEAPDVIIHPKDSVVMEVIGYSFQETTKFRFGFTVRFPRCIRIRHDKTVADATSTSELRQIMSAGPRTTFGVDMVTNREKKKRRVQVERSTRGNTNVSHPLFSVQQPSEHTTLFEGYEFCILQSSTSVISKENLSNLLLANGAQVVQNPLPSTSLLLATSSQSIRTSNWIAACVADPIGMSRRYACTDVVDVRWALRSIEAGKVLPLTHSLTVYASPELQSKFNKTVDRFLDPYFDFSTEESTSASIQEVIRAAPVFSHNHSKKDFIYSEFVSAPEAVKEALGVIFDGGAEGPVMFLSLPVESEYVCLLKDQFLSL